MIENSVYPFAAVIGQDEVKKALILNIINPFIGGVLISGEKGTAKSTVVRGLAQLMQGMKVINLPLNITEDRLVGTIDIEEAITKGERNFQPGILKKAHKNILYIDEVNLLSEHIVNCLLEVSSLGINTVEREGISYRHKSEFVLVGTMNPEEGNLRSQFLDRFGLYLDVKGSNNVIERKEIIRRRLRYEENPIEYINEWKDESKKILLKILKGKECLKKVEISENVMKLAVEFSEKANCSGHRAELVIIETAKAIAAYENRKNITVNDIKEAAKLALPHRMRDTPPKDEPQENYDEDQEMDDESQDVDDDNLEKNEDENNQGDSKEETETENDTESQDFNQKEEDNSDEDTSNGKESSENEEKKDKENSSENDVVDDIGRIFTAKSLNIHTMDRKKRRGSGKRSRTKTDLVQGRYIRYTLPKEKSKDIAFDATLRAAAPYQKVREKHGLAVAINKNDFREKVREKRTGSTIMFIVDASGSMGAKKRMTAVKGAIVSLLTDVYQKRDKVGMIAFRKKEAEVLLGITRSVELAEKSLKTLPTGGKTPLASGLSKGYEILKAHKKKDPDMVPVMVLVSDGRANSSKNEGDPFKEAINMANIISKEGIQTIVIDTEQDFIKLGLAKEIAQAMDAEYYKLEDLEAGEIAGAIRECV